MKKITACVTIALISAGAFLAVACSNPQSPDGSDGSEKATVAINLYAGQTSGNSSARTILPELSGAGISWDIELNYQSTGPEDIAVPDLFSVTDSDGSETFRGVEPGSWLLTASGTNQNGDEVASVSQVLTVALTKNAQNFNVPVVVPRDTIDPGDFSLNLKFPGNKGITHVEASLSDYPNVTINPTLTTFNGITSVTIASNNRSTYPDVAPGTHLLSIKLWRGNPTAQDSTVALNLMESVNIWSGMTSNRWLDAAGNPVTTRTLTDADFADSNAMLEMVTPIHGMLKRESANTVFNPETEDYTLFYNIPDLTMTVVRKTPAQTVHYWLTDNDQALLEGTVLSLDASELSGKDTLFIQVTAADGSTTNLYTFTLDPYYTVTYLPNGAQGSPIEYRYPVDFNSIFNYSNFTYIHDGINLRVTDWISTDNVEYPFNSLSPDNNRNWTLRAKWSVIGGIGPAGGLVFYDKQDYTDGWRYLEIDNGEYYNDQLQTWAPNGMADTFYTDSGIDSGKANTLRIDSIIGGSAAHLCQDHYIDVNGITYNDWFLPSASELNFIWMIGLGSFKDAQYWTSSKSSGMPSARAMDTGVTSDTPATESHYVRAIRAFADSQPLYAVVYDANGGTGALPSSRQLYRKGQKATVQVKPTSLTRVGYTFKGWGTTATASTYYQPGNLLNITNEDYLLFAIWAAE